MKTTLIESGLPHIETLIDAKINDYVFENYGPTVSDDPEEAAMVRESMTKLSQTMLTSWVPVSKFSEGDEAVAEYVFNKLVEIDGEMEED